MVTIKVDYTIKQTKTLKINSRKYFEYHGDTTKLKEIIAKEHNINPDDIYFNSDIKIIEGDLDFDNLDK